MHRFLLGLCLLAACGRAEAVSDRPWARPGDRVDSILPMPEYLRRFRNELPEPGRLGGGSVGKEALAAAVLAAVSKRDTAALRAFPVSRAEFAWIVYPAHMYSRPPYELDPALFWLQLKAETDKGLHRLLARLGGHPLHLVGMHCTRDTLQLAPAGGMLWGECRVRFRDAEVGDGVVERKLFGSIVERDGHARLLSYANDF